METAELQRKAITVRRSLLTMIYESKTGHTGGALSSADILTALFYRIMRLDPSNPEWPDRDRFILSKGHCVEGYYAILADLGFIPKERLKTFSTFGSELIGHPNNKIPGIEMNTGALGHGLSIGTGMALGLKKSGSKSRVFVLMGDGELAEGSVWEAAMAASHYKLDNLTAIIDRNHLQISGDTEKVMALEPLRERWQSFGWQVKELDGNNMAELVPVFENTPFLPEAPSLVIAHTLKGKGVKSMENVAKWHHGVPDESLYMEAMAYFAQSEEELMRHV
jgi:transketolase